MQNEPSRPTTHRDAATDEFGDHARLETSSPEPMHDEAEQPAGARFLVAKGAWLLILLLGSIAITSAMSMCSNRGIGKLIRRIEHRYGSDD